jgi:ATP-dependent DNA helicase PIF1
MTSFDTAFRRIAEGDPFVMVLGGAGTGKTTFLHELRRRAGVRQVFLAPTGVAALQLRGQTIHSFFGIPPRILDPDGVKPRARSHKLLSKIDRLVIDEVSMVRCDLLDVVDRCLRSARNRTEPFGGVQVVLVGDFLQLPPVVPLAEQEMLARMEYSGPYAFDAKVLQAEPVARVSFTTVHRQTDRTFVEHLTRIRLGERVSEAIDAINIVCCRPHRADRTAVILAPTNARVDAYNRNGLSALVTPERIYRGEAKGEFDLTNDRLPVPESLALKVAARVMAVRNDVARRWVNGSVGSVTRLADDRAWVRLDTGDEVEIERTSWERIRYAWNDTEGQVEVTVIGSYTQLPLIHAWASTVHKAQGLTLDDVRIDFDSGAFAPGQSYVALSRARSLDGLSLARPLRASDVRVDRRVANFMAAFESDERALRLPAPTD